VSTPVDNHGVFWRLVIRPLGKLANLVIAVVFAVVMVPLALAARLFPRPIDIGLGPEPLINNVYHKKALELLGFSAETFVDQVYYITSEFDVRGDLKTPGILRPLRGYYLFIRSLFRYRAVYLYFNGGPLMTRPLVWRAEPWLYRLAGIKVVVMPYGADVQEMSRSRNLAFKHAYGIDYPEHRHRRRMVAAKIDLWTRGADHVISGVEWVDYLYHWDTLMLGHFSIDAERWDDVAPTAENAAPARKPGPLRIFHAPNHRAIKGTAAFETAVAELQAEGVEVELVMLQRVSNDVIRQTMLDVDIVADQLVVGWYAMFALEAMSMGKPVLCYLRPDLIELYETVGLIERDEIPIISCDQLTVKDTIRAIALDPSRLDGLAERGRAFVRDHHSLEVVGAVFDRINRSIGIEPRGKRDS